VPQKTYLIADLHFGHESIIKYENRPFRDVSHMDETIIRNWNQTVSKTDLVIVAGDVSFYDKDKTAAIVRRLQGRKILVRGNHDARSSAWWVEAGFAEVSSNPIIINDWFVVSHEPPHYTNEAMPYFFIYGHVHSSEMYRTITRQTACVSAERWDFTPVLLETIVNLAKEEAAAFSPNDPTLRHAKWKEA